MNEKKKSRAKEKKQIGDFHSKRMMKLKIIVTSKVYQQLFIFVLLLQNSVSGQIDWAEDDDDPGEGEGRFSMFDTNILIDSINYLLTQT